MDRINLRFHSRCTQTLKQFLGQYKDPALTQTPHTPKKSISIFHLDFASSASLLMDKLFCKYIKDEASRLYNMFREKPMEPLTSQEWKDYNKAKKCHICFKSFQEINPKVRDHCHYTGQYREPAHRNCNLRYKIPSHIPIIFHNLSGYDTHLFIRELGKETYKIGVITENKGKYISFTADVVVGQYEDKSSQTKEKKIQLRFIDSMRLMASSVDSLTNNLVKDGRKLTGFEDCSEEQYGLLIRKGVYPYEYVKLG